MAVSLFDLTAEQIENVEEAVGLPMSKWQSAPSQMRLYRFVLAQVEGKDPDSYKSLTLREMSALVDLGDDPNPQRPSEPSR